MSIKINRNEPASGPAAQESNAPQRSGPKRQSIFSKPWSSMAPKNNSTSMAPRASTPLPSPEQRAAPSGSPSWSTKSATSLLGRAQKVVSSGMKQAGKAMSGAYQALNQPNYTPSHASFTPAELERARYHNELPTVDHEGRAAAARAQQAAAQQQQLRQETYNKLDAIGGNLEQLRQQKSQKPPAAARPNSGVATHGGGHAGVPARQPLHSVRPQPGSENVSAHASRPRPTHQTVTSRPQVAPMAKPMAAARQQPASENIDPNVGRPGRTHHAPGGKPTGAPVRRPEQAKVSASPLQAQAHSPAASKRPLTPAAETQKLVALLSEVDGDLKISDKKNYGLQVKVFESSGPEQAQAEKALAAHKAQRGELIGLRNQIRARITTLNLPQAQKLAQGLERLAQVEGPRQTDSRNGSVQGSVIRSNFKAMEQHGGLLGKQDQLVAARQQLRDMMKSGMLDGLPPHEFSGFLKLAKMDVGAQFGKLHDLEHMVVQTEAQLERLGGGGLLRGVETTPQERAAAREAELSSHAEAMRNGY